MGKRGRREGRENGRRKWEKGREGKGEWKEEGNGEKGVLEFVVLNREATKID